MGIAFGNEQMKQNCSHQAYLSTSPPNVPTTATRQDKRQQLIKPLPREPLTLCSNDDCLVSDQGDSFRSSRANRCRTISHASSSTQREAALSPTSRSLWVEQNAAHARKETAFLLHLSFVVIGLHLTTGIRINLAHVTAWLAPSARCLLACLFCLW